MSEQEKVYVTKTFLPPFKQYQKYLKRIWKNKVLTNHGPILQEFENALKQYLHIKHFHFVNNGTIALQIALKALNITKGEVITTPFSYVATVSSILWERCTPVFVDIDPHTWCIDPLKIEKAITKKTKAIMPVHVFGYPCNVEMIEQIANKYNVKVIYDGAHAFGVTYKGKSLFNFGDITVGSFHATKVFHTIEGGCIISKDKKIHNKIDLLKKFGHHNDDHFSLGINAKASEFQAAMGLCNLLYSDKVIQKRKKIVNLYNKLLKNNGRKLKDSPEFTYNYGYYPILLKSKKNLQQALAVLNKKQIYPRRYFYPSLNTLPYLKTKQSCPISEDISSRILCLPLYTGINKEVIYTISSVLQKFI